jgi:hypothetical protein
LRGTVWCGVGENSPLLGMKVASKSPTVTNPQSSVGGGDFFEIIQKNSKSPAFFSVLWL